MATNVNGTHAFTVRIPTELHEDLKAMSEAEQRSIARIVRDALSSYLEQRPVEEIKALLAAARSLGSATEEEMLQAAKVAAELDTSEGLGELEVIRE